LGYADGLMGGNLWFFGATAEAALDAAMLAADAAGKVPGIILPFPGGVASSGSKAGSKYKFAIASTYAEYCPTLRTKDGVATRLPEGVASVQEIVMNGPDLATIATATQAAIAASQHVTNLKTISAGNYNGRLGKSFIYLHPQRQAAG
jgi:formylmethanofuran--tetrahydromethanopterin N-formyltransferase